MEPVTVRAALLDDAARIAPVHRTCWHDAYNGLVPQRCLDELDAMDLEAVWRGRLGQAELTTTIALVEGQVVGMATVAARAEAAALPPELRAVYVTGARWGQGIGRLLLETALGERPAVLWVFEANERARGFYARAGWRATGQVRLHDWAAIPEVQLVRGGGETSRRERAPVCSW